MKTCQVELESGSPGSWSQVQCQLSKLITICFDTLSASYSNTCFSCLTIINRIVDVCIWNRAYDQPYDSSEDEGGGGVAKSTDDPQRPSDGVVHTGRLSDCTKSGSFHRKPHPVQHESLEKAAHVNIDRIIQNSLKLDQGSPRHRTGSWRIRPPSFKHRESQRSLIPSIKEEQPRDTIPADADTSSFHDGIVVGTEPSVPTTALDVLMSTDPARMLTILRESITKHKQLMGTRHRCVPSVRWRNCSHHCLQILSARVFTVICHSSSAQHKVINGDHLKTLVDALDPNHDPVRHVSASYLEDYKRNVIEFNLYDIT